MPIRYYFFNLVYGLETQSFNVVPTINDTSLQVDLLFKGLQFPTSMAFLSQNDILVTEKNSGTIERIVNGEMMPKPLLHVNVDNRQESGLLGIAVSKNITNHLTYVFLYYTGPTAVGDKAKNASSLWQPSENYLYRYELIDNKLVNPKLLFNIPSTPISPNHKAGRVIIGPDKNVYLVVGELDKFYTKYHITKAQNFQNGAEPDGSGGILRMTQDGKPLKGILADKFPLNLYYAYGIRNSFGMDFDPITKKLWDTENGPDYGDEINLVEPGFNSGWAKVQGIWQNNGSSMGPMTLNPNNLVDFGGRGKYKAPEFTWNKTVAPTAIKFLNSDKLGKQYENDMFVGDYNNGWLYHFKLNQKRDALTLNGPLADHIAVNPNELQGAIFGYGFGGIMDVQVGPDGYLYILSVANNTSSPSAQGNIYRIVPTNRLQIPPYFS